MGLVFTFGTLWALLAVMAGRGAPWAFGAAATTLLLRFGVAWTVGWNALKDRQVFRYMWLIPVRDLIAVAIWISSLTGHEVTWRGERFRLQNGKLSRIQP
jgi:ceramide glucosyltransferase